MEADPAASKLDNSPPQAQARGEPPSKEQILFIAQSAVANLQESLHKQLGQEVDEATKAALAKSLNVTCDVYLASLNLTQVPEELTNVIRQGVTRITFAHNRLSDISNLSRGFVECHSLKYLVLRSNELREFPAACFELPNLELLDLKKNYIEFLPEDLDRMTHLRVLSVVRNKIQRLPVCVGQMKALHQFATRRNPIVFPPKEFWAMDNGADDDAKGERPSPDKEKTRDMAETAKIKKYLHEYRSRERLQEGAESDMSESNLETPRPARRKTSGRFPIKPSVSGIEYNTDPIPASPLPPRPPPLPSKSYARASNQPINTALRPGVAPLINNNERNRSNSESQMPTSVREKRMGIVTRKHIDQDRFEVRKSNRLSHLRGLSHGSALQNTTAPPVSDSSSPASPVDADFHKLGFSRRLSSLPEGKRNSRLDDPHIELAKGLLFAFNQVYIPIRDLISILRNTSPKRTSMERTFYNASTFLNELGRKLTLLEAREEDIEDDEKRQSTASIYDSCVTCIRTFEQLVVALKRNMRAIVSTTNPQLVRTMMHLLFGSLVEVRNSCLRLGDVDLRLITGDEYRDFDQARPSSSSSSARRPATGIRVRERQGSVVNGSRSEALRSPRLIQKQPSFGDATRSEGPASFSSSVSRGLQHHAPYGIATPALSRNNTFGGLEDDDSPQFDQICHKVNSAAEMAVEILPSCMTMLSSAKNNFGSGRATENGINSYDLLLDRCRRVRDGVDGLKRRLNASSIKDPALSSHPDFWSSVTIFTREYLIFAEHIKHVSKIVASFPYEIKPLLKPLHAMVKDVSRSINNSPWSHLAATHTLGQKSPYHPQQPFAAAQMQSRTTSGQSSSQAPPQLQHPMLSLQTRGVIAASNPSDPMSAVSVVSSNGNSALSSGHVTPLPATPMSAALGPAALATMPMVPDLPSSTQQLGAPLFASTNANGTLAAAPGPTIERSAAGAFHSTGSR